MGWYLYCSGYSRPTVLAVFGVIATGATLDSANPAADAFRQGAGQLGYFIFGLVLFVASITSVVGNSYMAISLIKTLFPVVARNEKRGVSASLS